MTVSSPPLKSAKEGSFDTASFRNVSACKRCRLRKHKCDQSLPRCGPCEKAQAPCVGYDPINKQEIPRSYVYFLENRVKYLDTLLLRNNIEPAPPNTFEGHSAQSLSQAKEELSPSPSLSDNGTAENSAHGKRSRESDELLDERSVPSVPSALSQAFSKANLENASPSIIPKLLFGVAVRHEILKGTGSSNGFDSSFIRASVSGSLFGESKAEPSALPSQTEAEDLTKAFFKFVSPSTPVLSRSHLQSIMHAIYCTPKKDVSPFNLYIAYIVFAIGAASKPSDYTTSDTRRSTSGYCTASDGKRRKVSNNSCTSESYKDSAMSYLNTYLGASSPSGQLARLEELQAIVLLCIFALLVPTSLPLGNLIELAMRSATDLRLYSDYDTTAEFSTRGPGHDERRAAFSGQGWIQELRRRLWWSVYSLERMIAPYMNRPFFIPDEVITAHFPSLQDDRVVTKEGIMSEPHACNRNMTHHHLKLRCLQSEIHRMIQYQQASQAGIDDAAERLSKTPSFLKGSSTFGSWRREMMKRLSEWRATLPTRAETSCESFSLLMELEYWQSVISLYRHSISIPEGLLQHYYFETSVPRPKIEASEDIDEIHLIMANACQRVIHIYREIQLLDLPNLTYLATDWVFVAGTYFLFSIWESGLVVSKMSLHDLDSTSLMATALLQQYEDRYPLAKLFRVNFEHMSDETVHHYRKARRSQRDLSFHGLQSHLLSNRSLQIPTDFNHLIGFEDPVANSFSPASWESERGVDLISCSSDKGSYDALSPFHGSPSLSEPVQITGAAPLIQSNLNSLDTLELSSNDWDFLNSDCWDLLDMSFPPQKESDLQLKNSLSEIPDELKHLDGIMVGWDPEIPKDRN